jgi:S1-C subfamily serine protease
LRHVIESNGFAVNPTKSRLQLGDCRQEVTGIGVNVFPNVNRSLIREVRAMIHAWRRYGLDDAERVFHEKFTKPDRRPGAAEPSFRRMVKGKLDFIQMVRGRTDPVYVKLRAKLHALDPTLIGPPSKPLPLSGHSLPGIGSDPGWTRWYQRLRQSVFLVEIETNGQVHAGTAFAYRDICVATAAHNIVGDVRIILATGKVAVGECHSHAQYYRGVDCALVKVVHNTTPLAIYPHLPIPGEAVAVIGFASVPQRYPSLGIYPGTVESINGNYQGVELIHITVAVAGGLSGSPVVNTRGQVIGIVVESTFEQTVAGVPKREFCSVLPIAHVSEVAAIG